jgi:cell division transport system ATP-binding protein
MIQFHHVSKSYDGRKTAVRDASFRVNKGEFVYLTGPSGAGKSTILSLILCEEQPDEGQVLVGGKNVARLSQREIPGLRRTLGVVFQDFKLIERKTVFDNVALPLRIAGASEQSTNKRVTLTLKALGIYSKQGCYPRELSGGEQQRAAIARALVKDPVILLADEPTGNLDWDVTRELMAIFKDVNATGTTVVFATHNREVIEYMPRREIKLQDGTIEETA